MIGMMLAAATRTAPPKPWTSVLRGERRLPEVPGSHRPQDVAPIHGVFQEYMRGRARRRRAADRSAEEIPGCEDADPLDESEPFYLTVPCAAFDEDPVKVLKGVAESFLSPEQATPCTCRTPLAEKVPVAAAVPHDMLSCRASVPGHGTRSAPTKT